MLEQIYKTIDIRPTCYPFQTTGEGRLYPSSEWRTLNQTSFERGFVADKVRFPLPAISQPRPGKEARSNNPHTQHVYHIWGFNKNPVCGVNSTSSQHSIATPHTTPHSMSQSEYTRKQVDRPETNHPDQLPVDSAVPRNKSSNPLQERMLPATDREKTVTMTTAPFLRYVGKKKKLPAPYQDAGVFYTLVEQVPPPTGRSVRFRATEAARIALQQSRYWDSISSLTGKDFSRRRRIAGPEESILSGMSVNVSKGKSHHTSSSFAPIATHQGESH